MFLFDLLFGSKKNNPAAVRPPVMAGVEMSTDTGASAPGTHIHYDSELIRSLKGDHGALLSNFTAIVAAEKAGDLLTVQNLLAQFQTMIQDHLLKENVRLYVYLEHLLENDPTSHKMMHDFRHEMDGIGRAVVGFLTKYRQIGYRPELAATFATDLGGIGEALVARIKREEGILYPMYSPPN